MFCSQKAASRRVFSVNLTPVGNPPEPFREGVALRVAFCFFLLSSVCLFQEITSCWKLCAIPAYSSRKHGSFV